MIPGLSIHHRMSWQCKLTRCLVDSPIMGNQPERNTLFKAPNPQHLVLCIRRKMEKHIILYGKMILSQQMDKTDGSKGLTSGLQKIIQQQITNGTLLMTC